MAANIGFALLHIGSTGTTGEKKSRQRHLKTSWSLKTQSPFSDALHATILVSQKVLGKCGFVKAGMDKGFANARQTEAKEFIYKLTLDATMRACRRTRIFSLSSIRARSPSSLPATRKPMKISVAFLLGLFFCTNHLFGQSTTRVYSPEVQDSFDIYINAGPIDRSKPVRYTYYLDAGIKSGKEIRRQLADMPEAALQNKVFVGVAHIGNFHQKRRRDFVPQAANEQEGHADRFYAFLTQNLLPATEAKYGSSESRSLAGHSFGGLFVCYSLFRTNRVFDKYFALSPSLWMNKYAILDQEASYYNTSHQLPAFLYLSAGSGETLNYILAGNRRMKQLLDQHRYEGLRFSYNEHPGKSHNSQVPESVAFLLHFPD
jgi:predicted alpha/beta superfamily hydrolase